MKGLTPIVKPIKPVSYIDMTPQDMGKKKKKLLKPVEGVKP